MKSRILVCGGRKFWNQELFDSSMRYATRWFSDNYCIIEGAAQGADTLAKRWGKAQGVAVLSVEANWDCYGDYAGTLRNTWMLDWCMPDLVIAFPGGSGTANMVKQATARHVSVWPVWKSL